MRLLSNVWYPCVAIFISAIFLFYKYLLQVFPGVIASQLQDKYNIDCAGLGHLSACYFYTYLIVQIFAGMLIDIYPVRFLSSAAIALCAISVAVFAWTNSLLVAELSRGFMGVGVSFATASYFKVASRLFPPNQLAFLAGVLGASAMLGAAFGSFPLSLMVRLFGWQKALTLVSVFGLIFSGVFFHMMKEKKDLRIYDKEPINLLTQEGYIKGFSLVFINSKGWMLSFASALSFSCFHVFSGLWGVPFIAKAYNLTVVDSSAIVSWMFVGFAIGAPVICYFAEHLGKKLLVMLTGIVASIIALGSVIYLVSLPHVLISTILFIFGFSASSFMLAPVIARTYIPLPLIATTVSMMNAVEALWTGLSEYMIGKLLDIQATSLSGEDFLLEPTTSSYQSSFCMLFLYFSASVLMLLRLLKTTDK